MKIEKTGSTILDIHAACFFNKPIFKVGQLIK